MAKIIQFGEHLKKTQDYPEEVWVALEEFNRAWFLNTAAEVDLGARSNQQEKQINKVRVAARLQSAKRKIAELEIKYRIKIPQDPQRVFELMKIRINKQSRGVESK